MDAFALLAGERLFHLENCFAARAFDTQKHRPSTREVRLLKKTEIYPLFSLLGGDRFENNDRLRKSAAYGTICRNWPSAS
jgi:hypothetical protein